MLRRSEGVFIVRAFMRKAESGEVLRHFVAFNAGTRMLYLGPWVWMLEEARTSFYASFWKQSASLATRRRRVFAQCASRAPG